MTVVKRNKQAKPDPELLKLSRQPTGELPEAGGPDRGKWSVQAAHKDVGGARSGDRNDLSLGPRESGEVTNGTVNTRNGHSTKTLNGDFCALPLDVPRDRQGTFEPQIVVKSQTSWAGFDDKIISL